MEELLMALEEEGRRHLQRLRGRRVTPATGLDAARAHIATYDFAAPIESRRLFRDLIAMFDDWTLHSAHPRYFGLFNPPALPVTVAADALVALYNPQVGTWTHSPMAIALEHHVLEFLAGRIGLPGCVAHFTSGGQEANTTAVAAALAHAFPEAVTQGLAGLGVRPRMYVSDHTHHSLERAARFVGLGTEGVGVVEANRSGALDAAALGARIAADRAQGWHPFLVVATAGTTGLGAIDPLPALARLCADERLWLHVDAAWGGSALLSDRLAPALSGIESADSVTWDAHKGMSVPMGAGMLFTRHREALRRLFDVHTGYVPAGPAGLDEPYRSTAQWSRRFIGLKVFAALAVLSRSGYARLIEHPAEMADRLRARLTERGYHIVNDTPLPLVCFTHPDADGPEVHAAIAQRIEARGRVWISRLELPDGRSVLRACITSFDTGDDDIELLVSEIEDARAALVRGG